VEYETSTYTKRARSRIVKGGCEVIDRASTIRERFTAVFWAARACEFDRSIDGKRMGSRQHLEQLGHDVIVADKNFGEMYCPAQPSCHDRIGATLDDSDDACQRGNTGQRIAVRAATECAAMINIRREMTDRRTRAHSRSARGDHPRRGISVSGGRTQTFLDRIDALALTASMTATLLHCAASS